MAALIRRPDDYWVTGLPRSGTSWAALAIKSALGAEYVYEPYNWEFYPENRAFELLYVPPQPAARRSADPDPDPTPVLAAAIGNWRQPKRLWRRWRAGAVVVKDVHASLATAALDRRLHLNVIVILRHPCAVAASWRRVGFAVDYRIERLLAQPRLLADHLNPYTAHLRSNDDFFFQIGALWGAVYAVLRAQARPAWAWVTHEALCAAPEDRFDALLGRFGRTLTAPGRSYLQRHDRPPLPQDNPFETRRETAAEPDKWRAELSPAEIDAVLAGCHPFGVLDAYYS